MIVGIDLKAGVWKAMIDDSIVLWMWCFAKDTPDIKKMNYIIESISSMFYT